ncbi:MAG TPA: metallopeptidase family protein [Bacteroidota bacterium]
MEFEKFEEIAEQAFASLPDFFKSKIENVEVVVEDVPSQEDLKRLRLPKHDLLLGLYKGIPYTERGTWYGMNATLPDRITLYRLNIEQLCRTEKDVESKIYEVLIHEIGHYFGMSDKEIHAAGY